MERVLFPFTAIYGHDEIKKALSIVLVNPKAGGLLISGPKGVAKSALVRAAAPLTLTGKIVELPLGATEDMVFGSLDLDTALSAGELKIRPGLLFRAAGTILYMDEVNLLRQDFLTAALDAAASGFFDLERDGISAREEISCIPVGTMNPEEGTLPPSVLDRFGLFAAPENTQDAADRVEILRRSLAFERDRAGFIAKYAAEEAALKENIAAARKLLPEVGVSEAIFLLVAQYCARAYCRGNRADIYLIEAAKALAALAERNYVLPGDVEEAALFVLPHRMGEKQSPPPKGQESEELPENGDKREEEPESDDEEREAEPESEEENSPLNEENKPEEPLPNQDSGDADGNSGTGDLERTLGAILALKEAKLALEQTPQWAKTIREGSGKRSLTRTDSRLGRYVRAETRREGAPLDIAFDATLRAAAPRQRTRRKAGTAVVIRSEDYRSRVREKRIGANIIFLVDASGSMAAKERMKAVKGAIVALLQEAYQKRDKVGLIAFRRNRAEVLLPVTRSVDLAEKLLRELPTGGKTPLADALERTLEIVYGIEKREKGADTVVVLLTDGRANAVYEGDDPIARAMIAAEKFRRSQAQIAVVDTENSYVKLGVAPEIARKMGATYYTLPRLTAERVLHIARRFSPG